MTFSFFFLFLILLHTSPIVKTSKDTTTDLTTDSTTDRLSTYSTTIEITTGTDPTTDTTRDKLTTYSTTTEVITITDPTIDITTDKLSTNSKHMEINTTAATDPTIMGITDKSSTDSRNTKTMPNESTIENITEDSITYLIVSTKSTPLLEPRVLLNDVTKSPENTKSKYGEQNLQSDKTNVSTVNVSGIVLASIVGSVAVFYILISLIKKYKSASYVVRSPNMELGEA